MNFFLAKLNKKSKNWKALNDTLAWKFVFKSKRNNKKIEIELNKTSLIIGFFIQLFKMRFNRFDSFYVGSSPQLSFKSFMKSLNWRRKNFPLIIVSVSGCESRVNPIKTFYILSCFQDFNFQFQRAKRQRHVNVRYNSTKSKKIFGKISKGGKEEEEESC